MANKYDRAFFALTQERSGYGLNNRAPSGKCILERRGGSCRIHLTVQDLKTDTGYRAVLISPGGGRAAGVVFGKFIPGDKGRYELRAETDPDSVMGSGIPLERFAAVALLADRTGEVIPVLAGYREEKFSWVYSYAEFSRRRADEAESVEASGRGPQGARETPEKTAEPEISPEASQQYISEPSSGYTCENLSETSTASPHIIELCADTAEAVEPAAVHPEAEAVEPAAGYPDGTAAKAACPDMREAEPIDGSSGVWLDEIEDNYAGARKTVSGTGFMDDEAAGGSDSQQPESAAVNAEAAPEPAIDYSEAREIVPEAGPAGAYEFAYDAPGGRAADAAPGLNYTWERAVVSEDLQDVRAGEYIDLESPFIDTDEFSYDAAGETTADDAPDLTYAWKSNVGSEGFQSERTDEHIDLESPFIDADEFSYEATGGTAADDAPDLTYTRERTDNREGAQSERAGEHIDLESPFIDADEFSYDAAGGTAGVDAPDLTYAWEHTDGSEDAQSERAGEHIDVESPFIDADEFSYEATGGTAADAAPDPTYTWESADDREGAQDERADGHIDAESLHIDAESLHIDEESLHIDAESPFQPFDSRYAAGPDTEPNVYRWPEYDDINARWVGDAPGESAAPPKSETPNDNSRGNNSQEIHNTMKAMAQTLREGLDDLEQLLSYREKEPGNMPGNGPGGREYAGPHDMNVGGRSGQARAGERDIEKDIIEKNIYKAPGARPAAEHYWGLRAELFAGKKREHPFDSAYKEVEWVRVEQPELALLPLDFWKFTNNSFVALAIKRYRHLLLGIGGEHCILAVPDSFGRLNMRIAHRLGFDEFRLCRKGELVDGKPGYWLMKLEFPDKQFI